MEKCYPVIWPEDPVPEHCTDCQECDLYKHHSRMVWGEGNAEAPILLLLDNPGLREDRDGHSFVCGTRQTMQQAAQEVGLKPEQLYATYVVKRRPVRAYDKTRTRRICMHHLDEQTNVMKPALVVCFGNVAVQSFFQNDELDVKSLRGMVREMRGLRTMATYHPLAVRRRPNLWPIFLEDWTLIAKEAARLQDMPAPRDMLPNMLHE